jgi:UDP-glucuronate decarboxylase
VSIPDECEVINFEVECYIMKILVAGGAGFLGSHLSESLLNQGHEVICLDNFYTGDKKNIEHLVNNPKFEIIRHDVTFPIYLEVEGIFNLACPASPVQYQRNPVQTLKTSVHGAINLLGLAKRTGARILQASTSEVYGDPKLSPQVEEYWGNVNPIGIRSCYDEGKRAAETLFVDYHRQYKVDIRIARIFNTFGPRMALDDGRVVSNFIVQALSNQDITVYGDGNQIRSFCYVSDLVEGLIQLFFESDFGTPINLGNPAPITILELANEIIQLTNSKSSIRHENLPSDDPITREPDITKAIQHLGWQPKVPRQEGLENTIKYFKTLLPLL